MLASPFPAERRHDRLLTSWGAEGGETRVCVGRLPDQVDRAELESIFAQYGPIRKWTFGSRDFALVEYYSHDAAAMAVRHAGNVGLRSHRHQRLDVSWPSPGHLAYPVHREDFSHSRRLPSLESFSSPLFSLSPSDPEHVVKDRDIGDDTRRRYESNGDYHGSRGMKDYSFSSTRHSMKDSSRRESMRSPSQDEIGTKRRERSSFYSSSSSEMDSDTTRQLLPSSPLAEYQRHMHSSLSSPEHTSYVTTTIPSRTDTLREGEEYIYTTLYIKNLAYQITEEDLRVKLQSLQCKRGFRCIRWITDKSKGLFTGEVFLEYDHAESAAQALEKLTGQRILGHRLDVSYAPAPRTSQGLKQPAYSGCKTISEGHEVASNVADAPVPGSLSNPSLSLSTSSIPFASPRSDGSINCDICSITIPDSIQFEAHIQSSQHWASVKQLQLGHKESSGLTTESRNDETKSYPISTDSQTAQSNTQASATKPAADLNEKGKWTAMPLKYRILKNFGMSTKETKDEMQSVKKQNSPSGEGEHAVVTMKRALLIEEEKLDKIEAGIARARERGEAKDREEGYFTRGPQRNTSVGKRKLSKEDSATSTCRRKESVNLKKQKKANGRSSENSDKSGREPSSSDDVKAEAVQRKTSLDKGRKSMEEEMQCPETDEEAIMRRMADIITKYDTMKDKNTAVAFLLNVLRNSNRTKIEVGTAWRNPPNYPDIYEELGMIKLPVVNGRYHMWQLPHEGSVWRKYLDVFKSNETKQRKKRGKIRQEEKLSEQHRGQLPLRISKSEEDTSSIAFATRHALNGKKAAHDSTDMDDIASTIVLPPPRKKVKQETPSPQASITASKIRTQKVRQNRADCATIKIKEPREEGALESKYKKGNDLRKSQEVTTTVSEYVEMIETSDTKFTQDIENQQTNEIAVPAPSREISDREMISSSPDQVPVSTSELQPSETKPETVSTKQVEYVDKSETRKELDSMPTKDAELVSRDNQRDLHVPDMPLKELDSISMRGESETPQKAAPDHDSGSVVTTEDNIGTDLPLQSELKSDATESMLENQTTLIDRKGKDEDDNARKEENHPDKTIIQEKEKLEDGASIEIKTEKHNDEEAPIIMVDQQEDISNQRKKSITAKRRRKSLSSGTEQPTAERGEALPRGRGRGAKRPTNAQEEMLRLFQREALGLRKRTCPSSRSAPKASYLVELRERRKQRNRERLRREQEEVQSIGRERRKQLRSKKDATETLAAEVKKRGRKRAVQRRGRRPRKLAESEESDEENEDTSVDEKEEEKSSISSRKRKIKSESDKAQSHYEEDSESDEDEPLRMMSLHSRRKRRPARDAESLPNLVEDETNDESEDDPDDEYTADTDDYGDEGSDESSSGSSEEESYESEEDDEEYTAEDDESEDQDSEADDDDEEESS